MCIAIAVFAEAERERWQIIARAELEVKRAENEELHHYGLTILDGIKR